jgi:hypothetical protein
VRLLYCRISSAKNLSAIAAGSRQGIGKRQAAIAFSRVSMLETTDARCRKRLFAAAFSVYAAFELYAIPRFKPRCGERYRSNSACIDPRHRRRLRRAA